VVQKREKKIEFLNKEKCQNKKEGFVKNNNKKRGLEKKDP